MFSGNSNPERSGLLLRNRYVLETLVLKMAALRSTSYRDVLLRELEEADIEVLYRIFVGSRDDLLTAVADWDEVQQKAFLRSQFEIQQAQYRSHYPKARFDVIVTDGEVIGNFYVADGDDALLLVDVNLLPGFRNRGIGRALLQDLLGESERSNKPVSLHVIQGNPAVHLYERIGFKVVGEEGVYSRMEWRPSWLN